MRQKDRGGLGVAALVSLTAVILAAGPAIAAEEARVGLLLPFSGPWAKFGNEMAISMEIARDLVNQSGGVQGGKQIVFVRADIPNPTAATSEANRLISQEKLQVLLGSFAAPLGGWVGAAVGAVVGAGADVGAEVGRGAPVGAMVVGAAAGAHAASALSATTASINHILR